MLHAAVIGRDDVYLGPDRVSRAAAARLRAGIAALESWLRRVLILMALQIEPDLVPPRPYAKTRRPRRLGPLRPRFRVFLPGAPPDLAARERLRKAGRRAGPGGRVWTGPLLARLAALRALVEAPEARARRLAWHLARRRPGRLTPPAYRGPASGRLFGTETGALHDGLYQAICERSRARPPPLGPAARLGPRLRQL